jgi:hypothetical protein
VLVEFVAFFRVIPKRLDLVHRSARPNAIAAGVRKGL